MASHRNGLSMPRMYLSLVSTGSTCHEKRARASEPPHLWLRPLFRGVEARVVTSSLTILGIRSGGGRRESKGHADCSLQSLYMCALLSWDCQDDIDNLLILSHLLEILFKIHAACSRILSMVSHTTSVSCVAQERHSPTQSDIQNRTPGTDKLAVHLKKVQ